MMILKTQRITPRTMILICFPPTVAIKNEESVLFGIARLSPDYYRVLSQSGKVLTKILVLRKLADVSRGMNSRGIGRSRNRDSHTSSSGGEQFVTSVRPSPGFIGA